MTNDEIANLARGYAEEAANGIELPNCLNQEAVNMFAKDMAQKISWLLRTHCIVSKEKVRGIYNEANQGDAYDRFDNGYNLGVADTLESLFDAETFKNSEV